MYYLILLLAYSLAQIALGIWIGRRVRTARDFFVAGRSLGPGLLFSTMLAANIGGGSTVGATALGYQDGLAAVWWVGSAALGSIVLALWIGPAIRRTAAAHDLRTVGDFLEFRFGIAVRTSIASLLWFGAIFILAGQLIAIATILSAVVGLHWVAGCILGGVLITIYFTAGGLLTSSWVNVVQLTVKLAGFAIALPLALAGVGGWSAVASLHPHPDYWNPWSSGQSGLVYLAMLGPAFIVSPGLLQKIYGARDDRAVRLGVGLNGLCLAAYAMVPVVLGMVARLRFPDLDDADLALPMILIHGVPAVVGGLGLAAVFSAELSAADAVLFMLTTSLSQDLYRRFLAPAANEAQMLRVTRITAVVAGTLGVAVALVAANVITALKIFYTLMTVGLLVPVLAGLYVRRAGSREAMGALVAGIGTVVLRQFAFGGAPFYGLTPAMAGLAAALAAFLLVLAAGAALKLGTRHPRST
jgi:solute:Na+ symporter, SSS family